MTDRKENILFTHISSLIFLLIILCGILILNETSVASSASHGKPVKSYESVNNSYGVSSPGVRLQIFQKTWIINKDHYNLLAFNRNPLSESIKANKKVIFYQNIRKETGTIPVFIFNYHLFPSDNDEPPLLS